MLRRRGAMVLMAAAIVLAVGGCASFDLPEGGPAERTTRPPAPWAGGLAASPTPCPIALAAILEPVQSTIDGKSRSTTATATPPAQQRSLSRSSPSSLVTRRCRRWPATPRCGPAALTPSSLRSTRPGASTGRTSSSRVPVHGLARLPALRVARFLTRRWSAPITSIPNSISRGTHAPPLRHRRPDRSRRCCLQPFGDAASVCGPGHRHGARPSRVLGDVRRCVRDSCPDTLNRRPPLLAAGCAGDRRALLAR